MKLTNQWTYEEINRFKEEVAKIGLDAKIENQSGWNIAKQLLDTSRRGLASRSRMNSYGEDETIHLDYLFQIVDSKETQATKSIKSYISNGVLNVDELYKSESF